MAPQDLGVVGFEDTPEAADCYPTLTTGRQNTHKLGTLIVECINTHSEAANIIPIHFTGNFLEGASFCYPHQFTAKVRK